VLLSTLCHDLAPLRSLFNATRLIEVPHPALAALSQLPQPAPMLTPNCFIWQDPEAAARSLSSVRHFTQKTLSVVTNLGSETKKGEGSNIVMSC
jgi:hypothetical protein